MKKNEVKGISENYRAVITFQLMILGIILGCLWVYWKIGLLIPLIGVLLGNGLYSIMNSIKVMSGDPQIKVPFLKTNDRNLKTK